MAYKDGNIEELMRLMRGVQGNRPTKKFARALGISPQYVSDIYNRRREPGPKVLLALGISRSVNYSSTNAPALRQLKEKLDEDVD